MANIQLHEPVLKSIYEGKGGVYRITKGAFVDCVNGEYRAHYHNVMLVRITKERDRVYIDAMGGGNKVATQIINAVLAAAGLDYGIETTKKGEAWLRKGNLHKHFYTTKFSIPITRGG